MYSSSIFPLTKYQPRTNNLLARYYKMALLCNMQREEFCYISSLENSVMLQWLHWRTLYLQTLKYIIKLLWLKYWCTSSRVRPGGRWDGLTGKGVYHHTWQLSGIPGPHDRQEEPIPNGCLPTSTLRHICAHTYIYNIHTCIKSKSKQRDWQNTDHIYLL